MSARLRSEAEGVSYQYSPGSPSTIVPFPPPPPAPIHGRDGRPSPLRPGHIPAPPPLSINVAYTGRTSIDSPVSAPIFQRSLSPAYILSPEPSPRSAFPMAARTSSNYSVPYDPREWAGGSRRTSMVLDGRNAGAHAEEGLASPPPPYTSGSTAHEVTNVGSTISPADSAFVIDHPSRTNTPTSTVGVSSPQNGGLSAGGDTHGNQYFSPTGRVGAFEARPSRLSIASPPSSSRPASVMSTTRPVLMTSLSVNTVAAQKSMPRPPEIETNQPPLAAAPTSRRAASAGATSSHSSAQYSHESSSSRSSSRQRSWLPGMPLPGPPPGPPPSSSRSQSTGGARTVAQSQASSSGLRPSHRLPIHEPMLSPMPPTPANWRDTSTSRSNSKAPMPLHVETTNLDRPSSTPAGLSRSAALRSAKGLLERRKQRRSLHEAQLSELSALTIETDPWFDGLSPNGDTPEQSPFVDLTSSGRASPETARRGLRTNSRSRQYSSYDRQNTTLDSPYPPGISRRGSNTSGLPSKALPTPPLSQKNPMSAHSLLPSTASSVSDLGTGEYDSFMHEAVRRHQKFLVREGQAGTELERLQVFMDFVTEESRLRRDTCPGPFQDGSFDVAAAQKLLFADKISSRRPATPRRMQSPMNAVRIDPPQRSDTLWSRDYQPELSPIASGSIDELSSRGRSASRWWQSQTGSEADGATKKMSRTKRESKYMGVPTLSMQEILSEAATPTNISEVYSSAEVYAQEKAQPDTFGFYDDEEPVPVPDAPKPLTPKGLDISRFVTLPPPYPRHYPGVNNSHPKLASYRNLVRILSDLNELTTRRSRHNLSVEALRAEHERKIAQGKQSFRTNVSAQIQDGSISYAEAAEAEKALRLEENKSEKECLQAEFDTLQDVVINPMHELLSDRTSQLSAQIAALTDQLVAETHADNLDRIQQEGDAVPELLEYLTQLKWLFETRETIHKEIDDLLSERNEKYKAIVLLPYHQNSNLDKIRDTEEFFNRDSLERKKGSRDAASKRYQDFTEMIAKYVSREVELQSSTFWDIAPGVLDLVQRIPNELTDLGPLAIPDSEYAENPMYYDYPQQYLYSLLNHAEKSTYQFIESQTSLHCLLHEVRIGLLAAERRAAEASQDGADPEESALESDPLSIQHDKETAATADLKQQVAMIEEQWLEALGSAIQGKKAQVKLFLEAFGGWDESIEEGV